MRRSILVGLVGVGLLLFVVPGSAGFGLLRPGEIVVADQFAPAIIRVDPETGAQHLILDDSILVTPSGVAITKLRQLIVADQDALGGAILRVHPVLGVAVAVITSGGNFVNPGGVAIEDRGSLIVADRDAPAIFRVNSKTGDRDVLSSGGFLVSPVGVAIDAYGNIVVADQDAFGPPGAGPGAILRVDPETGDQSVISMGGVFVSPRGVAVEKSGDLIVADGGGPSGPGTVIRIGPGCSQSVVSAGGLLGHITGIAINAEGDYIVANEQGGGGPALVLVNHTTGAQTLLSSGGFFVSPTGLAIVRPLLERFQ